MNKVRFGIIGAGRIATKFALSAKLAKEVEISAVASRTLSKAEEFAAQYGIKKAYGSYEELLHDDEIDAVYIATPHSHHKQNCLDAMKNGKHILCEKPLALTKADAQELFAKAAEKKVFLMEAMWTRFLPTTEKVHEWVQAGEIGNIRLINAMFGFKTPDDPQGRMLNKELAGGALYDIGVYVLEFMQDFTRDKTLKTVRSFSTSTDTGVDGTDVMSFAFDDGAYARLTCTIQIDIENSGFLYGDNGYIKLEPDFFCPRRVELYQNKQLKDSFDLQIDLGYEYQIRHAARCILEGKLVSGVVPPKDTIECAGFFDTLLTEWGYRG